MATEFLGQKRSEYFYCSGFCCYLGLICLLIHRTLLYNPGWPQTPISPASVSLETGWLVASSTPEFGSLLCFIRVLASMFVLTSTKDRTQGFTQGIQKCSTIELHPQLLEHFCEAWPYSETQTSQSLSTGAEVPPLNINRSTLFLSLGRRSAKYPPLRTWDANVFLKPSTPGLACLHNKQGSSGLWCAVDVLFLKLFW